MTVAQQIPFAISISIFLMVFTLGLDAEVREATYLLRRPGLLFRSIFSMNVLMLVFAVAAATVFDLHPAVQIALVAIAVSPVPPILPKKQLKADGSESYAIGLLVAAVLFSVVMVPASIELVGPYFGKDVHMPVGRVVPIVLLTAILPLLAGMFVRHFLPAVADRLARPVSLAATALLLLAVLPILFMTAGTIWSLVGNGVIWTLVLFSIVGLAIGHALGGPDAGERTDLALATCTRHPGIALAIATLNFPERKAEVMAVIICHLIIGAIVAIPYIAWRRRAPASDTIHPVRR